MKDLATKSSPCRTRDGERLRDRDGDKERGWLSCLPVVLLAGPEWAKTVAKPQPLQKVRPKKRRKSQVYSTGRHLPRVRESTTWVTSLTGNLDTHAKASR